VFVTGLKLAGWVFVTPKIDEQKLAYQITAWGSVARKDGILALEAQLKNIDDPFVYKGLQMLVDGNSAEKIREVMDIDLQSYETLRWQAARVWESAAGYSPTIGIIGAVLGLVHVMQSLGEPAKLGAGIAVAFIATIYGVGSANLLFLPIAGKLKILIAQQVNMREMLIEQRDVFCYVTLMNENYAQPNVPAHAGDDIVRGYEVSKGKFVVVTDEELEAIEPRKTRDIDLRMFVDARDIDPMFFERAYYLTPAGGSTKAYRLLAAVMEKNGRAGIATFVMRAKESMVAILAERGILRAETLRFQDEIRRPGDLGLPKRAKPKSTAVTKFTREIGKHSGRFSLRDFKDEAAERLEKLVSKKQREHNDIVKAPEPVGQQAAQEGGEVIDLVEALRTSLQSGASTARRRKRKAG